VAEAGDQMWMVQGDSVHAIREGLGQILSRSVGESSPANWCMRTYVLTSPWLGVEMMGYSPT